MFRQDSLDTETDFRRGENLALEAMRSRVLWLRKKGQTSAELERRIETQSGIFVPAEGTEREVAWSRTLDEAQTLVDILAQVRQIQPWQMAVRVDAKRERFYLYFDRAIARPMSSPSRSEAA
jgi:hypothetical protein